MSITPNNKRLILIPSPLGDFQEGLFSESFKEEVFALRHFVAERAKTGRHFLKALGHPVPLQEIEILEWGKRGEQKELEEFLDQVTKSGSDIGLLSEAGCPGIADPGAALVRLAHLRGMKVVPLIGPSSILLAMMASGMNGQKFSFTGYLPVKRPERIKRLKSLEDQSKKFGETKIFIETPYRNMALIQDAIESLHDQTQFCIAADLSLPTQWIKTMTIKEWKSVELPDLHKIPAVFLLLNDSQLLHRKYGKR